MCTQPFKTIKTVVSSKKNWQGLDLAHGAQFTDLYFTVNKGKLCLIMFTKKTADFRVI